MTAQHAVADDTVGKVARKIWEVERRIVGGSLDPVVVLESLQAIIDGGPRKHFRFTAKRIAALKYLIFNAKNGSELTKRILAFLIDQSERLTKEVCLSLVEGREGYSDEEIHAAGLGAGGMSSANGTTHLDQILCAMGSKLGFSLHYGDFDPQRRGDPFSSAGQFAGFRRDQVYRAEHILEGLPMRYTFWLSKRDYSRRATLVVATREELEKINLNKPGLYPGIERD